MRSISAPLPISRLDQVGQANLLLNEAGRSEGEGRDGDALAFHRDVLDYKNCLLVEQPNGDFAQTIARHLLYTTWQHILFEGLTGVNPAIARLSEFAHKAVKEVAYHRELAADWTIRLGDGTDESAGRMAEGLDWNWRFVPELFEVDAALEAAIDAAIAPDPSHVRQDAYRVEQGSRPSSMKRGSSSSFPRTSGRFSAGGGATTASISGVYRQRHGDAILAAHLSGRHLVGRPGR